MFNYLIVNVGKKYFRELINECNYSNNMKNIKNSRLSNHLKKLADKLLNDLIENKLSLDN